jgi:4-amino-4-deoxy-L-arabinose transferase-like glycosyltransferase
VSTFAKRLALIVVLAMAVRVVQTLALAPWPPEAFDDQSYYSALSRLIATGEGFVRPGEALGEGLSVPTAERAPVYPAALAAMSAIGLESTDAQRLLGTLTGGAAVLIVGWLGRRLAGPRAGLIAAGIAAVYPTLIAADGALMTESMYGVLAGLSVLTALHALDAPSWRSGALLGAVAGIAALTRGEGLFLFPLLLLPLVLRRERLPAAGVACLAFVLVLTPWTIRNTTTFDRPVLVATEAGETIGGANCRPVYFGGQLGGWEVSCIKLDGRKNEAAELNAAGRQGIRYALDHATRVPLVFAARLARTWSVPPYAFQAPEGRSPMVMKLGVISYFVLLPLAVAGLVLVRRGPQSAWVVCAPVVAVTLVTLAAYRNLRFRHSAEMVIVLAAGIAIDALLRRRKRGAAP